VYALQKVSVWRLRESKELGVPWPCRVAPSSAPHAAAFALPLITQLHLGALEG
jgi:hypothetical protein